MGVGVGEGKGYDIGTTKMLEFCWKKVNSLGGNSIFGDRWNGVVSAQQISERRQSPLFCDHREESLQGAGLSPGKNQFDD